MTKKTEKGRRQPRWPVIQEYTALQHDLNNCQLGTVVDDYLNHVDIHANHVDIYTPIRKLTKVDHR